MKNMASAIEESKRVPAQQRVEVARGLNLRRTEGGIPVVTVHYSADPDRDPDLNPQWKKDHRKTYSSQANWDREQEIVDEAGGGELVFAETLRTHWNKIVITDPAWQPGQYWRVVGGFDHGKTNPTALERAYIDHDGNIYFCGEYYVPGKNVWQHAPEILKMPDIDRFEDCFADPSVFDQHTQQTGKKEEAKNIADLYVEQGVKFLSSFAGNRSDLTFAERVLAHWANLDEREPSLYIVCRNFSEKPQPGLHPWDSPNLLWELMRTRKRKLSATQLMNQNPAEQIIDKDNHARDAKKYIVMSLPPPAEVPKHVRIKQAMEGLDPTHAMIKRAEILAKIEEEEHPAALVTNARQRMAMMTRRRRF